MGRRTRGAEHALQSEFHGASIALPASACESVPVRGLERAIHDRFEVAAIVSIGECRLIGHLRGLDEIDAAQFERIPAHFARSLIDQLLLANGMRPEGIDGYTHEEFTHDAVAATVASGLADVGFGIQAAAARYDLDFVPLVQERYGFAMTTSVVASEEGKQFLARLSGNTFRQRLMAMPGYGTLPPSQPGAWSAFLAG